MSHSPSPHSFDTLKIHAGYDPKQHQYSVQVPIYQTVSYELGDTARVDRLLSFDELGWLYSRIGNPTVGVLEERIAALDGGTAAVAVASGMAALSYAILNVAEGGGRIVTTSQLYGGSFDAFKKLYPKFGIDVAHVEEPDDPASFERAITVDTKAILIESISNPDSRLLDVRAIADIAHRHGIPLLVDNTFATPYLFRPFDHGADIVIYSATKGIGGHGAALGGLIVENGNFDWNNAKFAHFSEPQYLLRDRKTNRERTYLELVPKAAFVTRIRLTQLAYLGAVLGPLDAYLLLLGLETLSERVSKQVATTQKIVSFLEHHARVAWVNHPSAKGSPYRALAERDFPKGAGTVVTFGFKGSPAEYDRFIDSTKLFSFQANVGDARSLIVNSPKATHGELTPSELAQAGIALETIRLSIGLESPDDLIADLEQAFTRAFS